LLQHQVVLANEKANSTLKKREAMLKQIVLNHRFWSFSKEDRHLIFQIYHRIVTLWKDSELFVQLSTYPELQFYTFDHKSPNLYTRFIQKEMLVYASFLYFQTKWGLKVKTTSLFQSHHIIPKHRLEVVSEIYPDFPLENCIRKGPNTVWLRGESHFQAHKILYDLFEYDGDLLAIAFYRGKPGKGQFALEAARAGGRLSGRAQVEAGKNMGDPVVQKRRSDKAMQREDAIEMRRENGRKGNREGKANSWKSKLPEVRRRTGLIAGRASRENITFTRDETFLWFYDPVHIQRYKGSYDKTQKPLVVLIRGYNLPKDIAAILNSYVSCDTWQLPSAGRRIGELIRGVRPWYVGWSVVKITDEKQLQEIIETRIKDAGLPFFRVELD
jgi:hypothetical protein